MNTQFCSKRAISERTGFSGSTLKQYRLSGVWLEGVHWQRINSRRVVYNSLLILDWIANRCNLEAHQQAIEYYLRSLPSNQKSKRGRK